LVTVDDHGRPTRRRVVTADLPAVVKVELDAFVARRLLATDIVDGEAVVGVAHEAFLTAWPPLSNAIAAQTPALRTRREVEQAAAEWDRDGRHRVRLWERGQLAAAMANIGVRPVRNQLRITGVSGSDVDLSEQGDEFLVASIRRDRRRRGSALTTLSVLLVAAIVAAGLAVVRQREANEQQDVAEQQRQEAEDQQRVATARQLLAQATVAEERDPQTALRLRLAAQRVHADDQTAGALVTGLATSPYAGTLTGHTAEAFAPIFRGDGLLMATGGRDSQMLLWDLSGGGLPRRVGDPLTSDSGLDGFGTFSPDGELLATWRNDQTVVLWDVEDPATPHQVEAVLDAGIEQLDSQADEMVFSPDGQVLAIAGSFPAIATLWDVSDPTAVHQIETTLDLGHSLDFLAFDPAGRFLITGSDDVSGESAAVRWDLRDPTTIDAVGDPLPYEYPPQFDPVTGLLAAPSEPDGEDVSLWGFADPGQPTLLSTLPTTGDSSGVIRFSPDGRWIAVGSYYEDSNVVEVWDLRDPADPVISSGQPARVQRLHDIMFTADPDVVVTVSGDAHEAIRWNFGDSEEPQQVGSPIVGATGGRMSINVFPDGHILSTSRSDGSIVLWALGATAAPRPVGTIESGEVSVAAVALRSSDDRAVVARHDGEVQTWDVTDPSAPRRTEPSRPGGAEPVSDLALTTDGSLVAMAGGTPYAVTVGSLDDAAWGFIEQPFLPGPQDGPVNGLAFSPRGEILAVIVSTSGGFGGRTVLYDVSEPSQPRRLSGPLREIEFGNFVAFSPDGSMLANGGNRVVQLYDIADPSQPRPLGTLTRGTLDLESAAFSADGRMVATGTGDEHDVDLWDISDPFHPKRLGGPLPGHAEPVSAIAFSPDGQSLATADDAGTVILWDVTDQTQPRRLGPPMEIGTGEVRSIDFADDSTALAVGSWDGSDGTVTILDLSGIIELRKHAVERACDRVGRGLDRDEWARYVPDLPFEETCPL
jgi:WD40 repeat protein